jgi:hypothetical protein
VDETAIPSRAVDLEQQYSLLHAFTRKHEKELRQEAEEHRMNSITASTASQLSLDDETQKTADGGEALGSRRAESIDRIIRACDAIDERVRRKVQVDAV